MRIYLAVTDGTNGGGLPKIALRFLDVSHVTSTRCYLPDGRWFRRGDWQLGPYQAIGALLDMHVERAAAHARSIATSTEIAYACRRAEKRVGDTEPTPYPLNHLTTHAPRQRRSAKQNATK